MPARCQEPASAATWEATWRPQAGLLLTLGGTVLQRSGEETHQTLNQLWGKRQIGIAIGSDLLRLVCWHQFQNMIHSWYDYQLRSGVRIMERLSFRKRNLDVCIPLEDQAR
jgi:hypothetical protein